MCANLDSNFDRTAMLRDLASQSIATLSRKYARGMLGTDTFTFELSEIMQHYYDRAYTDEQACECRAAAFASAMLLFQNVWAASQRLG